MKTGIPYRDWLNLMAESLGMDRKEFADLSHEDRRSLLLTGSGMAKDAFYALDATAQAQAIRKHSGDSQPPKPPGNLTSSGGSPAGPGEGSGKTDQAKAETKAGKAEAGGGEGEAEGEGSEGDGDGEEAGEAKDPTVTLGGLSAFLETYVQVMVDERLKDFSPPSGAPSQRFEVKLPNQPVKSIEGHVHPKFQEVLEAALDGFSIMLVGPAGTGKTTLGRQVAKALDRAFGSVSCTAGMSEGELVGKLLPGDDGGFHYRPSQFVTLYESGGVFLVDEIDAADPNVLLKINQSIGAVRGGGLWHNDLRHTAPEVRQHKDFVLIAAANTFGTGAGAQYVGRNQLDAATLDRFEQIEIDYDTGFEAKVGDPAICDWLWSVRKKAAAAKLRRVVSTRAIERCSIKAARGKPLADIQGAFFTSWTADEIAKVAA